MKRLSEETKDLIATAVAVEWASEDYEPSFLTDIIVEELEDRGLDYEEISRNARAQIRRRAKEIAKRWR